MQEKEAACQDVTVRNLLNQIAGAGLVQLVREGKGRTPSIFHLENLLQMASGRN